MPRKPSPGISRLATDLSGDAFGDELAAWLAGAPPFRAFAETNRDKIRKKLRGATDAEARRDVRAELLVARLLLADRRVALAFEPGGAAGGPDFAVSFREGAPFGLEVTRPRGSGATLDVTRPILAKLRQLPSGMPNALLLALPAGAQPPDVGAAVRALRARADAKDEAAFARAGFDGTRGFYDRFLRLGAVISWAEPGDAATPGVADAWLNGSARSPIPDRALRATLAALAGTIDPARR